MGGGSGGGGKQRGSGSERRSRNTSREAKRGLGHALIAMTRRESRAVRPGAPPGALAARTERAKRYVLLTLGTFRSVRIVMRVVTGSTRTVGPAAAAAAPLAGSVITTRVEV